MPIIKVGGDVNSIAWEGRRVSIWENVNVRGKDYSRLWTCWFDAPQHERVQESDWVEIEGDLSTKIGSYTPRDQDVPKDVVEHHLNNSKIIHVRSKADQESSAAQFDNSPF